MIRFLRYLVFVVIVTAAAAYGVLYLCADRIVTSAEKVLTARFIAAFAPGRDDQYGYEAQIRFWPPAMEVSNLFINAHALRVDGDIFEDCELRVRRITCDLLALFKDREVKIKAVEGIEFSGLLTRPRLAERLERTGGAMNGLVVEEYRGKARIRGRFGNVNITNMTVTGVWAIDDRGVITLTEREYNNPDSPVPAGMVELIENQTSFDVRIRMFDTELAAEDVSFSSAGLEISAHD